MACQNDEGDALGTSGEPVRVINVEVMDMNPTRFEEFIRVTGDVQAESDVILSAEETGRIQSILAAKGETVRRGQPLLKIDDQSLQAQLAEAEADSELAQQAFEKQAAVWANEIGTELSYLQRKRELATISARLRGLRTRLNHTVIRAPFDGRLESRFIEVHEMATVGLPLLRVLSTTRIKVAIGVPERYAAEVKVGARVVITFDILPEKTLEGIIRFVGSAVDPRNRTFPVEILIDNPSRAIKPGMIANARIVRRTLDAAIVVPQESIRYTEKGFLAYVAKFSEQGWIAEERPVAVGPSYDNRVVIIKGLRAGDQLIVQGQTLVAPGSRIEIINKQHGSQQ